MTEFWQKLREQVGKIWGEMSWLQRLAAIATVLLAVGLVTTAVWWSSQPEYRVLYAELSPEEAGAVTSALENRNIDYRLTDGGTRVWVPASEVARARIELAMDGLPGKNAKGFDHLEKISSLGTPRFLQHSRYLRALEGELARSIMEIDGVKFARVHIVQPKPSVFQRERKPATASVVLRLDPGKVLDRKAAAGITYLVSRAVEGLEPERVTLVDAAGKVISLGRDSNLGPITAQIEYQQTVESYLSKKAEDLLTRYLGPGRAVVRVSAEIDQDRVKEQKESYLPEAKVPIWEMINTTQTKSTGPAAGGPVGATANLGKRPAAVGASTTTSDSTVETSNVKYAIPKVIREFETRPGKVKRLSIAAVVDLQGQKQEGKTSLDVKAIEGLIKNAVGFKDDRDDITVTVGSLVQEETPIPGENDWVVVEQWQTILRLVQAGSIGLLSVVLFVLGWMAIRGFRRSEARPEPVIEPPTPAASRVVERISNLAKENPEALAAVLSQWLDQASQNQESVEKANQS